MSSINKNDVLTVYDVASGLVIKDLKFTNEVSAPWLLLSTPMLM
jgi:hypothetical protein